MKIEKHHSKIFFYVLVIGFFLLLVYSILIYWNAAFAEGDPAPSLEKVSQIIPAEKKNPPDIKEDLIAKAYVIYDINDHRIVRSQNAQTQLPIASLTKVITVGTLLDTAKKNNIQLRDETRLRIQKALVQSSNEDADSLGYVYNYSFGRNLLDDANTFIASLGINDLHLTNLTGLDNMDGTPSNVGSAEAIAKVFGYMYEHYRDVYEYTKFDELDTDAGTITNTNQTTKSTFGIIASKTGFTYAAGGNLAVIVSPEPGKAYVIVVMNSTKEGRFTDMQKITKLLPLILKDQD